MQAARSRVGIAWRAAYVARLKRISRVRSIWLTWLWRLCVGYCVVVASTGGLELGSLAVVSAGLAGSYLTGGY